MYIKKVIIWLAVVCLILIGANVARAGYIELKGADVLEKGTCIYNEKRFLCVIVKLEDIIYVVLLDQKGEYAIYVVGEKESTLLWLRDSV